ncbi:short-chain dehydrogenase/reductase family 9C member 7-like isoform X2 [Acanthaster planci]|uniref:Short-chain dehydrogenase/reductase family 9C member 7-like isoform X2 n=1 Tax=Acanthaster planci TaxID=133434 RepID=A0A8B7YBN1_ACAPL|nr:short-chain dehydrogenase/reductase family 9C member 7-like isoform X2 [Acanthaster planci]
MMVSWLIISAVVIASLIVLQNFMDKVYLDTVGKYVLITGCDSGFGNLLARTLGKQRGCHVIAACLTKDAAVQLKRDMAGTGQVVTPILLDVRSSESIRKAYQEVQRIIPPGQGLWGLVNNAGINKPGGPYEWLTREEINTIFQVNFLGTVEVTSTFLPLLIQAHGRVVNMSSCTAMLPMVGTAYAASKTAVEAYSDNLRGGFDTDKAPRCLTQPPSRDRNYRACSVRPLALATLPARVRCQVPLQASLAHACLCRGQHLQLNHLSHRDSG